jgi:hypothetical protein
MNRDTWVIVALAVLVIGGGWFWYTNAAPQGLSYFLTQQGDRQHTENTDLYTVQAVYPDATPLNDRSGAVAESRAENAINGLLAGEIKQFKAAIEAQNLSAADKERITTKGPKFSINIQYHPFSSGSFVSYEFEIFMDTGGVHPTNYFKTLVFDLQGNTVSLSDLFSNPQYLSHISQEATKQVTEQLKQRAGNSASSSIVSEGLAPKEENFQNFVVDSDRIRIFIPPYQAAAYAAGSFEVQIPLVDIKDILRPNVK